MQRFVSEAARSRRRSVGVAVLALVGVASACSPVGVAIPEPESDGGASVADGSARDAGALPDADVCAPGSVATYHPVYHPVSVQLGACASSLGSDLVSQFYEACFGDYKSSGSCQLFRSAYPDCASCILTPEASSAYGPIIDHGSFVTANVPGCIEREVAIGSSADAGSAELGCAKSLEALGGCEYAACEANCPVHDTASLSRFEACATMADAAGCSTFASAAWCATPEAGPSDLPSVCMQADFASFYFGVVPLFCVSVPSGGSDAGSSADGATGD